MEEPLVASVLKFLPAICIGVKEGITSGHWDCMYELETFGVYMIVGYGGERKKLYLTSIFPEMGWKY